MKIKPLAACMLVGLMLSATAFAADPGIHLVTFRFANQGDAVSMDPHSLNESLQLGFLNNIYEGLVGLDRNLKLTPVLATDWKQVAPTVWRFHLRKNVTFHDGTPFTADDVIFSYDRARADGSDVRTYVGHVKEIHKIDDFTLDFVTDSPVFLALRGSSCGPI